MKTSFYTEQELSQLGLKSYGENVRISRYAQIYSPEKISIGNNVRIDDFCILSGNITLGSNIHIAAYCGLYGQGEIIIEDYCGLSSRCAIYSVTDDYLGDYLVGPMAPIESRNVIKGKVHLCKYVVIATGCTIMQGVTIAEGTAVGAMSLVMRSLKPWSIYMGTPIKCIGERSQAMKTKIKS